MITQLNLLRDLLATAVEDATCDVSGVTITAGRPAAPSGEGDCQTAIFVYGDNVADELQDDLTQCMVRSRWAIDYEIWTCYPEDWEDQTGSDDAEDAATCFYELIQLVWCAVVEAKATDYFCDCSDVELAPIQVQPRSGGAVSAIGQIVLPYFCPTPDEESPTSP